MADAPGFPTTAKTRATLANAHRNHRSPSEIRDLEREHAAAKIADYIQRTVDGAPPLTPEQRERLAELLRPVPTTAAAS